MSSTPSATPEISSPALTPDAQALLRLSLVPGLRGTAVGTLLDAHQGDAATLARQPWRRLASLLPPALAARLQAGPDDDAAARNLAWAGQAGNRIVTLLDPDYPAALRLLADPPLTLWLKGRVALLALPALAVVGSRRATPLGLLDAQAFSRHLGAAGVTIVSGLAEGIDGAAHLGALDTQGGTIAVLAHGLDRIYPPRHRALAHRIAEHGLLLSEYPLATAALRHHFPERNRLISGLSMGVLVVEASVASGSLHTARSALEQGREVMAIPGSIHSPQSKGCHQLIREGASLVENLEDIRRQLDGQLKRFKVILKESQIAEIFAESANRVMACLVSGPAGISQIAAAIGLTAEEVSSILVREELLGRVARLPDGCYQRLSAGGLDAPPPDKDS